MTKTEYLLIKLMEECNEVSQRCSKALVFRLDEVQDGQPNTNAERIMHEMADLVGVYQMLVELGELPAVEGSLIDEKKDKVERYYKYSQELGVVDDD
jgi:hypothetical protein